MKATPGATLWAACDRLARSPPRWDKNKIGVEVPSPLPSCP